MKKFLVILPLFLSMVAHSQTYDDGTRIKYRLSFVPLEISAEWITADKLWSSKISTGISANYFNVYYFDSERESDHVFSLNPKIGLDFRKYFKNDKYRDFYGYYMEVSTRYFFMWTDYDGYLWIAYHFGVTLPIGNNAYVNGALGGGLYNNDGWGIGPTGTFGIGIDLE